MNNKECCEAKWRRRSFCISSIFDAQKNRGTIDKHETSRPNRLAESANLTSNCQKWKIAGVRELVLFYLFIYFYCHRRPSLRKPASAWSSVTRVTKARAAASSPSPTAGTTSATLAQPAAEDPPSSAHPIGTAAVFSFLTVRVMPHSCYNFSVVNF